MDVRVHLADDHTMFREGLAAILSSREGVEVVGQSGTGEDAVAMVGPEPRSSLPSIRFLGPFIAIRLVGR